MSTRKLLSALLALLLALALLPAAGFTAQAANVDVEITQSDTVAQIQSKIQNAINTVAESGTVTVTGSKTGASFINLSIPEGKTIIWKATLSGSAMTMDSANLFRGFLSLSGFGTFEVASGGSISSTGGLLTIGLPTISDLYDAIIHDFGNLFADNPFLDFTKGLPSIVVSGGTVTCSSGAPAIHTFAPVTVAGGAVSNNSSSAAAITCYSATTVTGGTVAARDANGIAISTYYTSSLFTMSSPGLAAYLAGTCIGWVEPYDGGLAVEVDTLVVPKSRDGLSTGLTVTSGTGAPLWDCTESVPKIVMANNWTPEWGSYAPEAPKFITPTQMTIEEGYAATSTEAFAITGEPAPTVTKTSGDARVTWNRETKTLDIAPGLPVGTYNVTLKAANGESPDATMIFVLTVLPHSHTHEWGADWQKDAAGHWLECACGGKDSFAHTPGSWIVDKAATATEDGSRHRTCSECGYVETQAIPATGVTPVKTIFNTRYEANFLNWLLFFLGFGWLWMWF